MVDDNKQGLQFRYCCACRRNQDQGKRHRYSTAHRHALAEFLRRAYKKISDVRYFVNNLMPLNDQHEDRNKFWCDFCDLEIQEVGSSHACLQAIEHLASRKHMAKLKQFWSENGADWQKLNLYYVSSEDYAKWKEESKVATLSVGGGVSNRHNSCRKITCQENTSGSWQTNNIHPTMETSFFRNVENGSPLSVQPLPVLKYGNSRYTSGGDKSHDACHAFNLGHQFSPQISSSYEAGDGRCHLQGLKEIDALIDYSKVQCGTSIAGVGETPSDFRGGMILYILNLHSSLLKSTICADITVIPRLPLLPGEGNVHTGAPPPWIRGEIISSQQGNGTMQGVKLLSISQERKLAKLRNPKRVGAAWAERRRAEMAKEHGGETSRRPQSQGANAWLPKFGRVWQSGSRSESRKEFEAEVRSELKRNAPKVFETEEKREIESSGPVSVEIKPYISKKQRTLEMCALESQE